MSDVYKNPHLPSLHRCPLHLTGAKEFHHRLLSLPHHLVDILILLSLQYPMPGSPPMQSLHSVLGLWYHTVLCSSAKTPLQSSWALTWHARCPPPWTTSSTSLSSDVLHWVVFPLYSAPTELLCVGCLPVWLLSSLSSGSNTTCWAAYSLWSLN